jgi:hypothetical protein
MIRWVALSLVCYQVGTAQPRAGEVVVRGTYTNADYGYSVVIPERMKATRMSAPAPQHGIVINLDHAALWVNAEYNSLARSLDGLAQTVVDDWFPGDEFRMKTNTPLSLAGLPALDVVLERRLEPGQMGSAHFVVALRAVPGEVGIVYTILVKGSDETAAAQKLFSRIVESFRLTDVK